MHACLPADVLGHHVRACRATCHMAARATCRRHGSLQAVRKEKKSHQQDGRSALKSLGRSSSVIAELWRGFGVHTTPRVPYLDQFPPYVARAMLMHAEVADFSAGDVIVRHEAGAEWSREQGAAYDVFVVLHGRVDVHSSAESAARDTAVVRCRSQALRTVCFPSETRSGVHPKLHVHATFANACAID